MTFRSHRGLWRFLWLPFGQVSAPAFLQCAQDVTLSGVRLQTCLMYLDDVLFF